MNIKILFVGILSGFVMSQCDLLETGHSSSSGTHQTAVPTPEPSPPSQQDNHGSGGSAQSGNNKKGGGGGDANNFSEKQLRYKGKEVILTKHARCRMDCRELDAFEVQEVINNGKINERKTDRNATPCPSIAYEGYTRDNQHARIIVGDCTPAKIITVIDLETDYDCVCE